MCIRDSGEVDGGRDTLAGGNGEHGTWRSGAEWRRRQLRTDGHAKINWGRRQARTTPAPRIWLAHKNWAAPSGSGFESGDDKRPSSRYRPEPESSSALPVRRLDGRRAA